MSKTHGLFPLFEAVVNSIQSVDSTYGDDVGKGSIRVEIIRQPQGVLDIAPPGRVPQEPIAEFRIRDNGAGFHSANMASFETLDSEYKIRQGCRGVGRLLWLKAFRKVDVESAFREDGRLQLRKFSFTAQEGVVTKEVTDLESGEAYAEVHLIGFDKLYQQSSRKKGSTIARDLLEHCLWYYVREGGAPSIILVDNEEIIDLQELFEDYMRSSSKVDHITVGKSKFDLIHLKLKTSAKSNPTLNWCAANRVVIEEGISGKISGLHGSLSDAEGEFTYSGYLTSSFLDERVRPERTDFELEEASARSPDEGVPLQQQIFQDEPTRSDIRQAVFKQVEAYLHESLVEAREKGRSRVETFVSEKAPRYRPILRHLEEEGKSVDPNLSDRELELDLHKRLTEFEAKVLREGQEVLGEAVFNLGSEEYEAKLNEYLSKVEDIKKSDLAAYVSRRKLILDLLAQAIERGADGRYCREDHIHQLLMPMRTTSDDGTHRASNLWIIDERLAFHNYLASDKTLSSMPITGSTSTKEPDLLALQICDSPILVGEGSAPTWASLSIVEIKRPMRNDAAAGEEKDPIEQCLNYLEKVRAGGVTTSRGRPIPAETIPGFCYVIADLTPSLKNRCRIHQLTPTDDNLGYFGYQKSFNAYIEVMSFDRLIRVAKQRNRAFFDVIGLPVA